MSFAELRVAIVDAESVQYPYVRRDKGVRARIVDEIPAEVGYEQDQLLIETVQVARNGMVDARFDPLKRIVSREYFDNNYWEGKD